MKTIHEIQQSSQIGLNICISAASFYQDFHPHFCHKSIFTLYFNAIPNEIAIDDIDCFEANIWFFEKYNHEINDVYFRKISPFPNFENITFMLFEDLLIEFNTSLFIVKLFFRKSNYDRILDLINELKFFEIRPKCNCYKSNGKS